MSSQLVRHSSFILCHTQTYTSTHSPVQAVFVRTTLYLCNYEEMVMLKAGMQNKTKVSHFLVKLTTVLAITQMD